MLEQISVSFSLPSSSWFWSANEWFAEQMCHFIEDMVSDVGDRARELEATFYLIFDKTIVGVFVDFENLLYKVGDFGRPLPFMIAPGNLGRTGFAICQPGGSQVVELAAADIKAGCGVLPRQGTLVEECEGVVDDLSRETMEKLFLFICELRGRFA